MKEKGKEGGQTRPAVPLKEGSARPWGGQKPVAAEGGFPISRTVCPGTFASLSHSWGQPSGGTSLGRHVLGTHIPVEFRAQRLLSWPVPLPELEVGAVSTRPTNQDSISSENRVVCGNNTN